jgi:hypothetical protein
MLQSLKIFILSAVLLVFNFTAKANLHWTHYIEGDTNSIELRKAMILNAVGTWVIDLRPDPAAEPYLKDFIIGMPTGKLFNGEYYGYPFEGGFCNVEWDRFYFAFTTNDGASTYFHSGYVEGNNIVGMSLNEERKFLIPWRGQKKS